MKNKAKSTGHGKPMKKEMPTRKVHVKSLSGHSLSFDIKSPGHGIDVMKGVRAKLKVEVERQYMTQDGVRIHPWTELGDGVSIYDLEVTITRGYSRHPHPSVGDPRWRCDGCGGKCHRWPTVHQFIVDTETGKCVCGHRYCFSTHPRFCGGEEDEFLVKCEMLLCEAKGYLY